MHFPVVITSSIQPPIGKFQNETTFYFIYPKITYSFGYICWFVFIFSLFVGNIGYTQQKREKIINTHYNIHIQQNFTIIPCSGEILSFYGIIRLIFRSMILLLYTTIKINNICQIVTAMHVQGKGQTKIKYKILLTSILAPKYIYHNYNFQTYLMFRLGSFANFLYTYKNTYS